MEKIKELSVFGGEVKLYTQDVGRRGRRYRKKGKEDEWRILFF